VAGTEPDLLDHGSGRPRRRTVIAAAVAVALLAGLGALRLFSVPHARPPSTSFGPVAHRLTSADARQCGQELPPPPGVGGPPDAGYVRTMAQIHPIIAPHFETAEEAGRWLPGDAPVLVVTVGSVTRAYPLAILQWHEVVDDVVAGQPIAVTYCPLCNTGVVYSRRQGHHDVVLAASGMLLEGALVLGAEGSNLLWAQPTGRPFPNFGRMGPPLAWLPSDELSLRQAAREHPGLQVLSRNTGFVRPYALSPYGDVARPHSLPALVSGFVDMRLPPKTRVVGVTVNDHAYAWQYDALRTARLRQATVGGTPVLALFRDNVTGIGDAYDLDGAPVVGSAGVYDARIDGRTLDFVSGRSGTVTDTQTDTQWSTSGFGLSGPLTGRRLTPLRFLDTYWFAWAAFHHDTVVWPPITTSTCSP